MSFLLSAEGHKADIYSNTPAASGTGAPVYTIAFIIEGCGPHSFWLHISTQ